MRRLLVLLVAMTLASFLWLASPLARNYPIYDVDADEAWEVEVNLGERFVSLVSLDESVGVLIDGDGPEDDGMYAGVYLRVGDRVFSGYYLGHEAPLLAPERSWVTQSHITVRASGNTVSVDMVDDLPSLPEEPGTYALVPPFRMQVEIIFGLEVVIHLTGLYYVLPTGLERVLIRNETGGLVSYDLSAEGPWRVYFEDIEVVEFVDSMGSSFRLETDAKVLQFEAQPPGPDPSRQVHEIDFDHSYKEYGQFQIRSILYIRP